MRKQDPGEIFEVILEKGEQIYDPDLISDGGEVDLIESMQSGEMAKGIEEALTDIAVKNDRVIFTNFPKSVEGVESIPDLLRYNKNLLLE